MRRFRFNLQRVLDYREIIEDKLLAELAAIRAEHERALQKLAQILGERDRFHREMKHRLMDGSPDAIKQAHRYLNDLGRRAKAQQMVVRELADRRDMKTDEVIEAARGRKILDRLKEYKRNEHRRDSERQDQKFLDEMASIRRETRAVGGGPVIGDRQ